jgi:hypothetical protein
MISRGKRPLAAVSAVLTALGVLGAAASTSAPSAGASTGVTLSSNPLGTNVAPWDWADSASGFPSKIAAYDQAAGISTFRYGGGSWADSYDWQDNRDIQQNCFLGGILPSFTGSCSETALDVTDYSQMIDDARTAGMTNGMVTVNYGSGTPSLAGAWASRVVNDNAPISMFEVGNEQYGCWEVDNELAGALAYVGGYEPDVGAECPMTTQGVPTGSATVAASYVANEPAFYTAIKAADPSAQVVVPYAIPGLTQDGYIWDDDLTRGSAASDFQGMDAHYYPYWFSGPVGQYGNPTAAAILQSLTNIPSMADQINDEIADNDPGKFWMIGESNVSTSATDSTLTPLGAVFAAGQALEWLAGGARTVDWWGQSDGNNNDGAGYNSDMSMFDNTGVPETPYWGLLLASEIAQPGAVLSIDSNNTNPNVLAFFATVPDGNEVEAYVNLSTWSYETVNSPDFPSGSVSWTQYKAGYQNSTNSLITSSTTTTTDLGPTQSVPPESVSILEIKAS